MKMETITKEVLLKTDPALKNRPYQLEALLSIFRYEKCLVKMFCGTGKSRIITNTIIHKKKELSVVVFPSLALIYQYSTDYLKNSDYEKHFKKYKMMNISSEKLENTEIDSTTDPKEIKKFLKFKSQKIILVTYQSYHVLLDGLKGKKIGLVCYDEAHHIVSPEYQKLVFGTDYYEEEVFFTATPRNDNGITMFDLENMEKNMCGPVTYDYTYLQGLKDEFLNQFDVCVDMYTENTNTSVYDAIARAILTRNNSRVLSFHSGVNGESNTDVWNFVNQTEFQTAFAKVVENEFPDKKGYYTNITFMGMDGNTPPSERKELLAALDSTPDNEIYIISSCETIGEGVDTKKANMCVFADPKASIVKIIQNIGRVVRRNSAHPLSTVLIPCWVNMENYVAANGDREKQDELIREQMRATNGDYAPILNVLGALRQDDPEIYEMCLNYPNKQHKEDSLAEQGFRIVDNSEDEDEDDDDDDNDNEEAKVYSPEEVAEMKALGETPLEIHTNDTIERFNEDSDEEPLMRLYHDEEEDVYKSIVRIDDVENDEDNTDTIIHPPNPTKRIGLTFHQNDEIQMLWRVQGELDFSKKFCTVVIECEVVKVDPMEIALEIVAFYKKEGRMPRELRKAKCTEELIEHNYYKKLQNLKRRKCPSDVKDLLDKELPGWRDKQDLLASAINDAKKIVNWIVVNKRMPKEIRKRKNECNENERMEKFCRSKLDRWKFGKCHSVVKDLLDKEFPGWRDRQKQDLLKVDPMEFALEIVAF
jgi:superfamily II DNA or RNA helicase